MSNRKWLDGARCLVTGASSHLGRAMASRLIREGARVILTSKTLAPLDETVRDLVRERGDPSAVIAVDADLTEPEGRNKLVHTVDRHFGALDLAINAAEVVDSIDLRRLFEINVFALIDLTRALRPLLQSGKNPALVNLGAIVESLNDSTCHEFQASKAAVVGFTRSIRGEWSRSGIHILLMNHDFTTSVFEKSHISKATHDRLAIQTLKAIRQRRHEVTPNPRLSHIFQLHRSLKLVKQKFMSEWMIPPRSPSTSSIQRLPRPHFELRMERSQKTGD